jgi:hypothetical protein
LDQNLNNMNENRILQQVGAIFSLFMTLFYLGVGTYLVFYADFYYIDKALRVIMGATFLFYGLYRAYRAYVKINEAFSRRDQD